MQELNQDIFSLAPKLPLSTNIITKTPQMALNKPEQEQREITEPQLQSTSMLHAHNELAEGAGASVNLPAIYGLKIRAINMATTQQQSQQQQQHVPQNSSNSLLKQQLRTGLKDIDIAKVDNATNVDSNETQHVGGNANGNGTNSGNSNYTSNNNNASNCCALQSLANVAERQMPNVVQQSASVNNLHHQLMLHMAAQANPLLKTSADFFHLQQQQQKQPQLNVAATASMAHCIDDDMDLLIDPNDKYEHEHDLTLADENAGFEYRQCGELESDHQQQLAQPIGGLETKSSTATTPSRPIQRRRVRRKAQSTNDDQAEHLTEMSVRGLDLFRYASLSEGVYQCTECAKENMQKTFKNKYSFQRHAFLYHEGKHRKVFPCPVCSKEFSRPDKMKNHMKMTHENFLPTTKDISNFNPLNYLITATAAGDMQASLYQQQSQPTYEQQRAATQHQLQLEQNIKQLEQQQQQQQQQQLQSSQEVQQQQQQQHSQTQTLPQQKQFENDGSLFANEVKLEVDPSSITEIAIISPNDATDAMLKIENDIIVKSELVISPSPTPPPSSLSIAESNPSNGTAQTAT